MNLIKALREAKGRPITRTAFAKEGIVEVEGGSFVWANIDPNGVYTAWRATKEAILADDWYVVETKSKIEEAIEREVEGKEISAQYILSLCRRIANVALDEAIAVCNANDPAIGAQNSAYLGASLAVQNCRNSIRSLKV